MKIRLLPLSIAAISALGSSLLLAEEVNLDPVVVNADFRSQKLSETPGSVSVIDESQLADKTQVPLFEVVGALPNVNFSAGASKSKYIQIRGIGERSQFETPINPSVGLIVDGIDFSQLTLGATLFDVKQIEVLRGPQGTTFGANGLAGVITVESNPPTKETEGHIEAGIGNYGSYTLGAAVGGTLIENKLLGRISVFQNSSDGYMKNSYLGRDDTNNIDELTIKSQLRWFVTDRHTIDLNYIHVDIDNGYDAFTLDNSRTSHSDQPGKDTQKTDAVALRSTYRFDTMHLVTALSYSDTSSLYSYDEDWSYVGEFDASLWPYQGFDSYDRKKKQGDFDIRLVSDKSGRIFSGTTDWTIGLYAKKYDEDMYRYHPTDYGAQEHFDSRYNSKNKAAYGQLDIHIDERSKVIAGLRLEEWSMDYDDSNGVVIDNDETMVGGKLGYTFDRNENEHYYVILSRGYKPGGVNPGTTLTEDEKRFGTESLWNLDIGQNASFFDDTLVTRVNFFYGKRKDMQVKQYKINTHSFTDYLSNAAKGSYYGLEAQADYYPVDAFHLYAQLGLLHAEFDEYTPELTGRAPAQSPKYQYNIGLDYNFLENWMFRANVEGRGSYYFSNTHDEKSDPYALFNSSLSYMHENWTVTFWGRNLFDETYETRGFYFGNNPANGYIDELYTQKGDPRTFGFTLSYDF